MRAAVDEEDVTKVRVGQVVRMTLYSYEDRTFDFILKTPPASQLLLKKLGKEKGSGKNLVSKVGTVTRKQLEEVATEKMADLNTTDMDQAVKIIAGTARSMGIDVKE